MLQKFRCTNVISNEMFLFDNSVQKVLFERSQFRKVGVVRILFFFELLSGVQVKVVLKVQKFRWTNVFTNEMFIFANFVQKTGFERSQFQRMNVALSEFYLLELSS